MANSTLTVAQMEQALVDSKELHEAKTTAEIVAGVDNGNSAKTVTDSLPSATDVTSATAYANTFLEEVAPPTGFNTPALLSSLKAQKVGSEFSCNIKPTDLLNVSSYPYANTYYVDIEQKVGGLDGTSWANAKTSIYGAILLAIASGQPARIFVKSGLYTRFKGVNTTNTTLTPTHPITIEAVNGRVECAVCDDVTWAVNSTYSNVYEATSSIAQSVVDTTIKDNYGHFTVYEIVNSLVDCSNNQGSVFVDGTTVYVHTHDSSEANNKNARVYVNAFNAKFNCNSDLYFYGIDFSGGTTGCIDITGGSTNTIVLDSCTARHAAAGNYSNVLGSASGVSIGGCGLFAAFNCDSSFNSKDGFGFYSSNNGGALTVNCTGYNNGVYLGTSNSCNGLTSHDGVKSIDIGGQWIGSVGCNSGHVHDNTQHWSYGTKAGGSDGDRPNGGSQSFGGFGSWDGASRVWLENCIDVGCLNGVYADNSVSAEIILRNHAGTGKRPGSSEFVR